jgi:hypothetical protein
MMRRAIAVITRIGVPDAPLPDQGDTEAKPMPAATRTKISEVAAATTAPARMAAQDTAEVLASTVLDPMAADL